MKLQAKTGAAALTSEAGVIPKKVGGCGETNSTLIPLPDCSNKNRSATQVGNLNLGVWGHSP
jgi:hypothetical protein